MKRILLALLVVVCGTTLSAQSTNMTNSKKVDSKKVVTSKDAQLDNHISQALLKDETLQDATFKNLDSNKETNAALAQIYTQAEGNKVDMMKQVLLNKKLSVVAIQYVKENPEMMEKAMKVARM